MSGKQDNSDEIIEAIKRLDKIDLNKLTVKDVSELNLVLRAALVRVLNTTTWRKITHTSHTDHTDHVSHDMVVRPPDRPGKGG